MKVFDPKLILLDETDGGWMWMRFGSFRGELPTFDNEDKSCLIITHHNEILTSIKADVVHIIRQGRLVL